MSNQAKTKPKQEAKPRKTYLFRIYPTRKQIHTLEQWLGLCCQLYNAALDERKSAYRMAGVSLSYEHQCAELPGPGRRAIAGATGRGQTRGSGL
jgi:putative transposase